MQILSLHMLIEILIFVPHKEILGIELKRNYVFNALL